MKTISFEEYYDKVYGGWIGKCIGGNIGAEVENNKYLMDLTVEEIFPEQIPPNDDLDLQLLWLHVLETRGSAFTSEDLADAWLKHCWYPFNEYGYFLHNYERGIAPPYSGSYNNHFFGQSMGSPIRSEIWAMISPGAPNCAAELAAMDACLDHYGESVWGEQFFAAIEAAAFFDESLKTLLAVGLDAVPEASGVARVVRLVMDLHARGMGWQNARKQLLWEFGDPDASKALQNIGITVLALLFGETDFAETLMIALNCGYDTDCTCATAGAILGIAGGASQIPAFWKEKAQDTFVIGIDLQRPTSQISDLARDTCRQGVVFRRSSEEETVITNIPQSILNLSTGMNVSEPITIEVDYLGEPEIGPEETKRMTIRVRNKSGNRISGVLSCAGPPEAEINIQTIETTLLAHETSEFPLVISLREEMDSFGTAIQLQLTWDNNEGNTVRKSVGLALKRPFQLIGPFWDLYDTTDPTLKPYYDPDCNRKSRPRGPEHFNNYVSIEREYIPEDSFLQEFDSEKTVFAAEHKLPVDSWIGAVGPVCVYLVQDIEIAEERAVRLVVGNNDAFKIWIDGLCTMVATEPWYWMPYNSEVTTRLSRGVHRIVIKLIRRSDRCVFSLGYAVPETIVRWDNDIVVRRIR